MTRTLQPIAFPGAVLAGEDEFAAGEQRFAALVHRQSSFVFRVAFAILRNAHDSEDVVQETFLKIYRGGAWEAIRDERAFLARTVWRIAVDMRSGKRSRAAEPKPAPDRSDAEESIIVSEKYAAIHRLMDALPEDLRQPLALSTVEELTSSQIAKVMGIAEGTVRSRLSRARQILKQKAAEIYGK